MGSERPTKVISSTLTVSSHQMTLSHSRHVHVHIYTSTLQSVQPLGFMCAGKRVCGCICVYGCVCVCVCVHVDVCGCLYMCMCMHGYGCVRACVCLCVYVCVRIHTCGCVCLLCVHACVKHEYTLLLLIASSCSQSGRACEDACVPSRTGAWAENRRRTLRAVAV